MWLPALRKDASMEIAVLTLSVRRHTQKVIPLKMANKSSVQKRVGLAANAKASGTQLETPNAEASGVRTMETVNVSSVVRWDTLNKIVKL
jgi:hypothetical protein